jgi:hypothetical protein
MMSVTTWGSAAALLARVRRSRSPRSLILLASPVRVTLSVGTAAVSYAPRVFASARPVQATASVATAGGSDAWLGLVYPLISAIRVPTTASAVPASAPVASASNARPPASAGLEPVRSAARLVTTATRATRMSAYWTRLRNSHSSSIRKRRELVPAHPPVRVS